MSRITRLLLCLLVLGVTLAVSLLPAAARVHPPPARAHPAQAPLHPVVGIGDGYKLIPNINIPPGGTGISIALDGTVQFVPKGGNTAVTAGQITLNQFVNPQGLKLQGGSIYTETNASGPPILSNPGENGAGELVEGTLETSNVDPVKELVTLIKTQRSFELNSQSIQTADQALQTIANIKK